MLKKLGMDVEELEGVERVEIVLRDRRIVAERPQVAVIKMRDQRIFQISSQAVREERVEVSLSEEDVEFVASQTGVSRERAREALARTGGNIAEAILLIREGKV